VLLYVILGFSLENSASLYFRVSRRLRAKIPKKSSFLSKLVAVLYHFGSIAHHGQTFFHYAFFIPPPSISAGIPFMSWTVKNVTIYAMLLANPMKKNLV